LAEFYKAKPLFLMRVLLFTYANFFSNAPRRTTRAGCIKTSVSQQKCVATLHNMTEDIVPTKKLGR